jgi:tetratricopeptide (TPR) repeat protein
MEPFSLAVILGNLLINIASSRADSVLVGASLRFWTRWRTRCSREPDLFSLGVSAYQTALLELAGQVLADREKVPGIPAVEVGAIENWRKKVAAMNTEAFSGYFFGTCSPASLTNLDQVRAAVLERIDGEDIPGSCRGTLKATIIETAANAFRRELARSGNEALKASFQELILNDLRNNGIEIRGTLADIRCALGNGFDTLADTLARKGEEQRDANDRIMKLLEELSRRVDRFSMTTSGTPRMLVLSPRVLSVAARSERIARFHDGGGLDWDLLAADADIRRDQEAELLEHALEPTDRLRVLCVVGAPASGKSVLAWRVALTAFLSGRATVVQVRNGRDPAVWGELPALLDAIDGPKLVVVDDPFRSDDSVDAFNGIPNWIPATVLATSRGADFFARQHRLSCDVDIFEIQPPSAREREEILARLGRGAIPDDRRRLLEDGNPDILSAMILAGHGKSSQFLVQDWIAALKPTDAQAYEYMVFAAAHGLEFPVSLLARLHDHGGFDRVNERPGLVGLVTGSTFNGYLRTTHHQSLVQHAHSVYSRNRTPLSLLESILKRVDQESEDHRAFAAHLVRRVLDTGSVQWADIGDFVASLAGTATSLREAVSWHRLAKRRDERALADVCVERIRNLPARKAIDFARKKRFVDDSCEKAFFEEVLQYIEGESADRAQVLGMAASLSDRVGTTDQQRRVEALTEQWLREHPDDAQTLAGYLGRACARKVGRELDAWRETVRQWFSDHPDDEIVRKAWLDAEVPRIQNSRGFTREVDSMMAWVREHEDSYAVRIALIRQMLDPGQRYEGKADPRAELADLLAWLLKHRDVSAPREFLLGQAAHFGGAQEFEALVRDTVDWLRSHPDAHPVLGRFLKVIGQEADPGSVEAWVDTLAPLFAGGEQPDDVLWEWIVLRRDVADPAVLLAEIDALVARGVRRADLLVLYTDLRVRIGDVPWIVAKLEGLSEKQGDFGAEVTKLAEVLVRLDQRDVAVRWLEKAVRVSPDLHRAWYLLGNAHLHREAWGAAAEAYDNTLRIVDRHCIAWAGKGRALGMLGRHQEAEEAFRKASNFHGNNPYLMGWMLLHRIWYRIGQGDVMRAARDIARGRKLMQDDPEFLARFDRAAAALNPTATGKP